MHNDEVYTGYDTDTQDAVVSEPPLPDEDTEPEPEPQSESESERAAQLKVKDWLQALEMGSGTCRNPDVLRSDSVLYCNQETRPPSHIDKPIDISQRRHRTLENSQGRGTISLYSPTFTPVTASIY